MFRNTLSFGVALLLAGATLLSVPGVSEAQRGGRGGGRPMAVAHFGGNRFGGFAGARSFGVARLGGNRFSGFYRGGFYGNYRYAYYRAGFGYPYYYGGLYRSYIPYAYYGGYYPAYIPYGYYGGYYPSYNPYGYGGTDPGYSSYMPDYYGGTSDSYVPSGTGTTTTVVPEISGNNAVIHVHLPIALADLSFDGTKTTSTGKDRVFTTPALTPGQTYTYTATANWTEGGVPRTEMRTVQVSAGQSATVDFSKKAVAAR